MHCNYQWIYIPFAINLTIILTLLVFKNLKRYLYIWIKMCNFFSKPGVVQNKTEQIKQLNIYEAISELHAEFTQLH